ncbi:MAG TPA: hypothetical protein VJU14_06970 [Solirubrobacterales bacterium]|nr:hypothetical protein [Solirubrobacterales bacterium]
MDAPAGQVVSVDDLVRSPAIDQVGRGNLNVLPDRSGVIVDGWALGRDREAIAAEALDEEGEILARVPIVLERPDVVQWVGEIPGAARSGFRIRLEPRRSGGALITLRVIFDAGEPVTLGTFRLGGGGDDDGGNAGGPAWISVPDQAARERVLIGRDDWLFLRGDRNDAIGQHTGRVRFDEGAREQLLELISNRRKTVERLGATWLTAIVPDKEMVYADFLPPEIVPVERRPVHDYLEVVDAAGASAVYMLEEMRSASAAGDLYMRTDTHWNYRGAFIAYQSICRRLESLGVDLDQIAEDWIRWTEVPSQGDLGSKLYPEVVEGTETVARLYPSWGRLVHDNKVRNHGRVLIHEQEEAGRPTCVVFGESFGPTLLFFLKESFRRVVFVHTSMLVPEVIEIERPEVVISLPIERFLIQIPDDTEAMAKLARTVDAKGGELPWKLEA